MTSTITKALFVLSVYILVFVLLMLNILRVLQVLQKYFEMINTSEEHAMNPTSKKKILTICQDLYDWRITIVF